MMHALVVPLNISNLRKILRIGSRLQARSHGNNILRKTVYFYGSEAAEFGVKVEHPAIALPQLAERSFGTWNVVEKGNQDGARDSGTHRQ